MKNQTCSTRILGSNIHDPCLSVLTPTASSAPAIMDFSNRRMARRTGLSIMARPPRNTRIRAGRHARRNSVGTPTARPISEYRSRWMPCSMNLQIIHWARSRQDRKALHFLRRRRCEKALIADEVLERWRNGRARLSRKLHHSELLAQGLLTSGATKEIASQKVLDGVSCFQL